MGKILIIGYPLSHGLFPGAAVCVPKA